MDVRDCECSFRGTFKSLDEHILVLYDTVYSHYVGKRMFIIMLFFSFSLKSS